MDKRVKNTHFPIQNTQPAQPLLFHISAQNQIFERAPNKQYKKKNQHETRCITNAIRFSHMVNIAFGQRAHWLRLQHRGCDCTAVKTIPIRDTSAVKRYEFTVVRCFAIYRNAKTLNEAVHKARTMSVRVAVDSMRD